jgi:hypothetical protein
MVDLTSHGVSFALPRGQLLADEIGRSASLDRASPLRRRDAQQRRMTRVSYLSDRPTADAPGCADNA